MPLRGQAVEDVLVVVHVLAVVEVDELITDGAAEDDRHGQQERRAHGQRVERGALGLGRPKGLRCPAAALMELHGLPYPGGHVLRRVSWGWVPANRRRPVPAVFSGAPAEDKTTVRFAEHVARIIAALARC